jgi:hypothetical protein
MSTPAEDYVMEPTPAQRTYSLAFDPRPLPDTPWRLKPEEPLSETPWYWPKPVIASPSPSPPRPPHPTRQPPPVPDVQSPGTGATEMFPEPELPPELLAQLVASLEGGKDINNLKHNRHSDSMAPGTGTQARQPERDQLLEHYPPPPSLQQINTQHSHHSSKNSAGHSYAFAGGRSHKASLTSTGSSSRRMTTEEKMSEVDEFFGLEDDEDGGPVAVTASASSGYLPATH